MSKTIDQRVVEMRFDNKDFENNVKTSMSTLDKLKQRLNLTGASKGLENISSAAKKCDLSPLGNAVQTVQAKFSALEVMGVTALANLTNSAVNAGKRIVSALTIDPVMSGFQEYETQINAIQTILANTSHQGTTLEDVNKALDELNRYADMTIYNFTEMTKNIGTFTAAGLDLKTSTEAIKGIANLAAMSGSTSAQASTAMYQLSQALAAGTVSLEDWNSVVNAGMGGKIFQDALIRTAAAMKGVSEETFRAENITSTFRESISSKGGTAWLDGEVLAQTLRQFTGDLTDAELAAMGFTKAQIENIQQMATTANDAATKVKTFTQLWDTLKETAQSGWTQTWEIIIGDFDQSKELFTEISDSVGGIINSMSESRNNLLEGALGGTSKWDDLVAKINEAGISTEDFEAKLIETAKKSGIAIDDIIAKEGSLANAFRNGKLNISLIVKTIKSFADSLTGASKSTKVATDNLEKFQEVVNKVIKGDFGNGAERVKALTDAGYDQVAVQKLVNKVWEKNGKTWKDTTITAADLEEVIKGLSESELQSIGYTAEQAKALKDLAAQAEKTGTPLNELINSLNKPTGRELLIDSFRNAFGSLYNAIVAVKDAWVNIFPPMQSDQLYAIIEGIHDLSVKFKFTEDDADKLRRTFEGLFAVIDLISTVVGGAFKIAFEIFTKVLDKFGYSILDVTAYIGDMLVGFRNFIKDNEFINKAFEYIADGIVNLLKSLKDLYDSFKNNQYVQDGIAFIKDQLSQLPSIGAWAIEGLKNGIEGGWGSLVEALKNIALGIIDTIKNVLGIHSPSVEMYALGYGGIMQGLIDGIVDGIKYLLDALKDVAEEILSFFTDINWTPVIAALVSAGLVVTVKRLIDIADAVTAPLQGIGDVLSSVSEVISEAASQITKTIKSFSKLISAKAFEIRAEAVKTLAMAIAILVGSVVVLTLIPADKLWASIGALAAIAAVIGLLSAAIGEFGPEETLQFGAFALAVLGLSASLLVVSFALKNIASIDANMVGTATGVMLILASGMVAIIAIYGQIAKGTPEKTINEFGNIMLKLSASFLILSLTLKIISSISSGDVAKGGVVLIGFTGIITLLSLITKIAGKDIDALGNTLIKMSAAMGILALVIKLIGTISYEDIIKGGAVLVGFTGIIALLSLITKVGGNSMDKLGVTLLAMSASILIMAGAVMLLSNMSLSHLAKGMAAVIAFSGIVALLTAITKLAGNNAPQVALTLLAMSASIAILATIAVLLGFVDLGAMVKGIAAVAVLSAIMAGLVAVSKFADGSLGVLVTITVAIGVLAASIGLLSLVDPAKLAGATAAMSVVMGMFALVMVSAKDINGSLPILITMTAAVGVIGGMLYLLGTLPAEQALAAATGISAVLLSMSATLLVLNSIKTISVAAYVSLGVLGLIAAALGLLLSYLVTLPNMELALDIALALSSLILSLSAACVLLAVAGALSASAFIGIAALVVAVAAVGGLVYAIGQLATENENMKKFLDEGIPILESIGTAIGTFFGNIIGGLIGGVSAAIPILGTNLSLFMKNVQPFIDGIDQFDSDLIAAIGNLTMTIILLTAADVINGIAKLFGFGNFDSLSSTLVTIGKAVVDFSEVVSGKIDAESVESAANSGLLLAKLANSLPRDGGILQSFFGTSMDLETFGSKLEEFGKSIVKFSQTVAPNGTSLINEEAVASAANAGKLLAELNKSLPRQGGALQDFIGNQDMAKFGEQIEAFGESIVKFSNTVTSGDNPLVNEGSVEAAVNAGSLLAELNNSLPASGGVLQSFLGEKDFTVWGKQLKDFGSAIVTFSNTVTKNGEPVINEAAVAASTRAGEALSALHNSLPEEGGILQGILGSKDLASFGDQIVQFGADLFSYSTFMKYVDPSIVATTSAAASSLVTLSDSLGNKEWFVDENTLDEFGAQVKTFGEHFSAYYEEVSTINVSTLSSVLSQVYRLINMAKSIEDLDSTSLGSFGENLKKLGKNGIDEFISAFTNANERVSTAVSSMLENVIYTANEKRLNIRTQFSGIVEEALSAMRNKVSDFGTIGKSIMLNFSVGIEMKQDLAKTTVKSMIDYILSVIGSKFDRFNTYGLTIATRFNSGLSKVSESKRIVIDALSSMVSSIRSEYSSFYDAGEHLVKGLGKGIEDNADYAVRKAKDLANSVGNITRKALEIKSPSRVFMQIGRYVALGLARGIEYGESSVEVSAIDMANKTVDSMSGTISKIVDAIEGKVDSHPTIRPVLDLSDIEANAARLNTMFSRDQAMSIGASINSRLAEGEIQNGENSVGSRVVNNSFVQNNYSPKALSRIEIYRQSKNLFSSSTRRIQPT